MLNRDVIALLNRHFAARAELVKALAEVLHLSERAVYKRLREEVPFKLHELESIDQTWKLGLNLHPDASGGWQNDLDGPASVTQFLQTIGSHLEELSRQTSPKIYYCTPDFPLLAAMRFPELQALKLFMWGRYMWGIPALQHGHFQLDHPVFRYTESHCSNIYRHYLKIPSVEIWSPFVFYYTLQQLHFLWTGGLLTDAKLMNKLLNQLEELIRQLRQWADTGVKSHAGTTGAAFELYKNDIFHTGVVIRTTWEGGNRIYMAPNPPNMNHPESTELTEKFSHWVDQLQRTATPLHVSNERERSAYFEQLLRDMISYKRC